MASIPRVWHHSPEAFFASGFHRIAQTRMRGLPIVNPRLRVKALGFTRLGEHWLGAVVTPWSILVILACGHRGSWVRLPATQKHVVTLPSGEYEFLGVDDPILGEYQVCSLMSPVTEIADQRTAEAIAYEALSLMLGTKTMVMEEDLGTALVVDPNMEWVEEPKVASRRAFLRGGR